MVLLSALFLEIWDGVSNSDTYTEGIDSKCLGTKSQ